MPSWISRRQSALPLLLLLLGCARADDGDVTSLQGKPGDACVRLEQVRTTCSPRGDRSAARARSDEALRAVVTESQGTVEGRALMLERCEQLAAQLTADAECRSRLAAGAK